MNINLLAQLIGAIAMLLLFATYQVNSRKIILLFHISISVCWIIHYGMLGAISGIAINVVCFGRNLLFYKIGENKARLQFIFTVIICILEIILTIAVWKSPVDLLALIGAPLQTLALWMKKTRHIRLLMLTASPLWLLYDYFNGSYVGIITETFVICSILISIFRFDKKSA